MSRPPPQPSPVRSDRGGAQTVRPPTMTAKTHAPSRRRAGLSRTQERTRCGRVRARAAGTLAGPSLAKVGETPTCKRCAEWGVR